MINSLISFLWTYVHRFWLKFNNLDPWRSVFSAEFTKIFSEEAGIRQPVDFKKGKLPVGCSKKLEEAFPPKNQQLRVRINIVQVVQSPLSQQNNNEVVVNCLFELTHT